MHHAIRALRIARFGAIIRPLRRLHQFFVRFGVAILQQVAGLLPSENVVGRHAPRRAFVGALAHQILEKERRLVEAPRLLAIRKHGAKHASNPRPSHEVLLVGSLVVRISGRHHHALDADFHHLVEELAHAVGVGSIEQSGVGGHAETSVNRRADAVEREIVSAFAAHRKIMVLFLPVNVHREA